MPLACGLASASIISPPVAVILAGTVGVVAMVGGFLLNIHLASSYGEAVIDAAEEAIFVKDRERRYTRVNSTMEQIAGLPASKLLGMRDDDVFGLHTDPGVRGMDARVLAGERAEGDFTVTVRGARRTFHVVKIPLRDGRGRITGLCGIARDITARTRDVTELNGVQRILSDIVAGKPEQELLESLCRLLESLFEGSSATVMLASDDGQHLSIAAAPSVPAEAIAQAQGVPVQEGLCSCASALYRREPVYVADTSIDPVWAGLRPFATTYQINACWSLPFFSERGAPLGSMALCLLEHGLPDERQRDLLERLTLFVSIVVERSRAQQRIAESERRFRRLAESIDEVFWFSQVAHPFELLYVSPGFEDVWGRAVTDLYASPTAWEDTIHPEDRARAQQAFRDLVSDPYEYTFDLEYRILRPDGEVRWIHDKGTVLFDHAGQPDRVAGIAKDITERRRTAEHQHRLMQELDHRVKNNLSSVLALAQQTQRAAGSVEDFGEMFAARIKALSTTHQALVATDWQGVDLDHLVRLTVSPYEREHTFTIDGAPIRLPAHASSPLCMTLHELVTNAVKHGALTTSDGRIEVAWRVEERVLHLSWSESSGPPVQEPARTGTGTELIKGFIEHELGGRVTVRYHADGLSCRIEVPLHRDGPGSSPLTTQVCPSAVPQAADASSGTE